MLSLCRWGTENQGAESDGIKRLVTRAKKHAWQAYASGILSVLLYLVDAARFACLNGLGSFSSAHKGFAKCSGKTRSLT